MILKIYPLLCSSLIIISLINTHIPLVQSAMNAETTIDQYDVFFENKNSSLAKNYGQTMIIDTNYQKAQQNKNMFPMYSYSLLLNCEYYLIRNNSSFDSETLKDKIDQIKEQKKILSKQVNESMVSCFASYEWIALAEDELESLSNHIKDAASHFETNDINKSVQFYIYASLITSKISDLISMSEIRDNQTSYNNKTRFERVTKNVSKKWIQLAETELDYVKSFGQTGAIRTCQSILNQSQNDYQNEKYYQALMSAAHAKAYAEYLTFHAEPKNISKGFEICQMYLDQANLSFSVIEDCATIDAPIAKANLENAHLHYRDAKNLTRKEAILSILSISIKEAFIASEQAKASMSVTLEESKTVSSPSDIKHNDVEITGSTEDIRFGWSIIVIICIMFLFYTKKR